MTEEEYQALHNRYLEEVESSIVTQKDLDFPEERGNFEQNIFNVVEWLALQVTYYVEKKLQNPKLAFDFSMLMGYIATRILEILLYDGKETLNREPLNENFSYLDALEVVKFNLDKRIEEMKKLKESSNG